MTFAFAWRPGWQYDVAAARGADSVLASNCRARFGRPLTRRGCCICVTVRLPVRTRGETIYWQANANTPLSVTPLLNLPYFCLVKKGRGPTGIRGFNPIGVGLASLFGNQPAPCRGLWGLRAPIEHVSESLRFQNPQKSPDSLGNSLGSVWMENLRKVSKECF